MKPQLSTKGDFRGIAKQLLTFQLQERKSIRKLNEKCTASWKENKEIASKDLEENNFQQQMVLTIKDRKALDDFK